jgi:hypothetical protein
VVGSAGSRSPLSRLRWVVLLASLGPSASMPWGLPPDMAIQFVVPMEVGEFDWWNALGHYHWPELLLVDRGEDGDVGMRMYYMRLLNRHLRRMGPNRQGEDVYTEHWSGRRRGDSLGAFAIADRLAVLAGYWAPGECALVIVAVVEGDVASGAQGALWRIGLFLGSGAVAVDGPAPPWLDWRPQGPNVAVWRGWRPPGYVSPPLGTPLPYPSGSFAAAVVANAGPYAAGGEPGSSSAHEAGLEGDGLSSETWPPASGDWRRAWDRGYEAFLTSDVARQLLSGILGAECDSHHMYAEAMHALGQAEAHHEAASALRTCRALQAAVDEIGRDL